jgi:hypothetical protein
MLIAITIAIMLIVAYTHMKEGIFTATCMLINALLAGLIAMNFWEPIATTVESIVQRSILQGYEDFFVLIFLYAISLGGLRALAGGLNNTEVEFVPMFNQLGAGAVALITGYLISGFLICAMETLPWNRNFLGFEPYTETESAIRRYFPPDRVWLALMHRAGATNLSRGPGSPTFDADGAFESNFLRFRRYSDGPPEATK